MNENGPGWPGNPSLKIEEYTSIKKGDSCNQYIFTLFNHFGSHMDGARHFNDNGARLTEAPFDMFFYEKPLLIDIQKGAGEKITKEDLELYAEKIAACDLLMIRTGFSTMRSENSEIYMHSGPSVGSTGAKYLMDHYRETLKAVALDFISLGSYADQEDAVKAHQYMLGVHHNNEYISIIEDINLQDLPTDGILSAAAIPLFMDKIDSSPITMWVEL